MTLRLVLHPEMETGVPEAMTALPGVDPIACANHDEVVEALRAGAPALLTHVWDERFLVDGLRWVQGQGAGFEQFPLETLRSADVVFTNARGAHPVAAEHALALLLALTRDLPGSVRRKERQAWESGSLAELGGSTACVVGLGAIGEQFARLATAIGMRLIGVTGHPASYGGIVADVRPATELSPAAAAADVLVVCAPSSDATLHLVDRDVLAALGDGWVVNVARGALVNERALVDWLREPGRRGAGLDVFEQEPPAAASPLWSLPNVVMTPHIGGCSDKYGARLAPIVAANATALAGGGAWVNRIV